MKTHARTNARFKNRPIVLKFGGTSVGSPEALYLALARVREAAPNVVVVVSAMNGVTDVLLTAARAAAVGESRRVNEAVAGFSTRHLEFVARVIQRKSARTSLESMIAASTTELAAICESIHVLHELTKRTLDYVAARGERILAAIFTAFLKEHGLPAASVDATDVVFTEHALDDLWPDLDRCQRAARRRLLPLLKSRQVPVVTGFIGTGPGGELVTLGRGGSDFSASLLARCLGARGVILFKDVNGLMTADPKAVPDARVLPKLHYREAAELAYYGAKILHPRTIIPLVERRIPLFIRNSFNPSSAGTCIAAFVKAGSYPVKALTAIHGQAIVSIEGKGMLGVPGIAARTFGALSQAGHSVSMISQASSEASICFVLPQAEAPDAKRALERAFSGELGSAVIDAIRVERPVSLIAVVGLGMAGKPGIAARTMVPLARKHINILAIAQGSSELNITLAVHEKDATGALRALHREFKLQRL
jgi:aspartokinase/homoserine dehydrogenase 1